MAIIASVLIALVAHLLVMRTTFGVLMRGVGGNTRSVARAGWSVLWIKGATLCGGRLLRHPVRHCTCRPRHLGGCQYRAALHAPVDRRCVLGGGEFVGGRVSPVGAVIGALTLTLAGSFLSFLRISPDWQIGAQGAILIIVLGLELVLNRRGQEEKQP